MSYQGKKLRSVQHKRGGRVHLAIDPHFMTVATMDSKIYPDDAAIAYEITKRWNEYEELIELLCWVRNAAKFNTAGIQTRAIGHDVMDRINKATEGVDLLDILRSKEKPNN